MDRKVEVALAQTAVTAVLWGTSFPAIAYGIDAGLDPRLFVFLRFALAAPLMLGASFAMKRRVGPLLRNRGVWVLSVLNAIGFLAQFVGQQYTGAQVAALLVNLSVVFAALGGAVFLREGFGRLKAAGIVLALVGTLLVTTGGDLSSISGASVLGDSLYLVAAVTWAWYIVYAKGKTDELKWDPVPLSASIVLLTAVFVLPFAIAAPTSSLVGVPVLIAVAYTAVFNTAIPFVLYQQGLRHLSSGLSALVLMLEIVVAVIVSSALLGEPLTLATVGGSALILVSIGAVSLTYREPDFSKYEPS